MESPAKGRWTQIRDRVTRDSETRQRYDRTKGTTMAIRHVLQRIDAERERAGLSKAELAERIGTSPAAVRRLFTSESANPTLRTVLELSDALGLDIALQPKPASHVSANRISTGSGR